MICILQTVCPTVIFNFPFSTFNLKKLPLGHNMLFDIYKLSARIGNGGSPCGRPMSAPTDCFGFTTKTNGGHWPPLQYINNFHIYKNSRATMICILQTVCPTAIFNFPFSTFNFKKTSARAKYVFIITYYLPEPGAATRCRSICFLILSKVTPYFSAMSLA